MASWFNGLPVRREWPLEVPAAEPWEPARLPLPERERTSEPVPRHEPEPERVPA